MNHCVESRAQRLQAFRRYAGRRDQGAANGRRADDQLHRGAVAIAFHQLHRRRRVGRPRVAIKADGEEHAGDAPRNPSLALDEFVAFVNAYGPQIPRRLTKADAAFEKQLAPKKVT